MSSLGDVARAAYDWHHGQVRKYTGLPYFTHPVAVAALIERTLSSDPAWPGWASSDLAIGAAFLHDVIEDCGTTHDDFIAEFGGFFGSDLYAVVMQVTQVSKHEDGNRAKRKKIDADHYAKSTPLGASIKLADMIDNARDIVANAPKFWPVYLAEMQALLPRLIHGHPQLYNLAADALIMPRLPKRFQPEDLKGWILP